MRLVILLIATTSFLGCGAFERPEAPEKPTIELCTLDVPRNECICGKAKGENIDTKEDLKKVFSELKTSGEVVRKPITYCDKFVSMPPKSWENLQVFIKDAIEYIEQFCGSGNESR